MIRRPPRSKRTDTLFTYTTLCRSDDAADCSGGRRYQHRFTRAGPAVVTKADPCGDAVPPKRSQPDGERCDRFIHSPQQIVGAGGRSEEHTSALQSLMRISYAVFCLNKKTQVTCKHHTGRTEI